MKKCTFENKLIYYGFLTVSIAFLLPEVFRVVYATEISKSAVLAPLFPHLSVLSFWSFLFGLGMIFFTVAGSEACRRIARYGIGTGVPSVSMYSIAVGTIASFFGFSITDISPAGLFGFAAGLFVSAVLGFICGKITDKILNMNIPNFSKNMTILSISSTGAFMAGGFLLIGRSESIYYLRPLIISGFVAVLFIGTALMIFHAYNANLGADEKCDRTRFLAYSDGFLWMFVLGILSFFSGRSVSSFLTLFVSFVLFIFFLRKYMLCVKRDAYKISDVNLLPSKEELL